ncbi:PucR family transcriptional regulator [Phytoactinopolyspora halotolerans]|uniref:PucR family transcriptional regulator n=1 Tax=Phytoactinopolyspora halotolerans TaxID=1981512 RepID=A0A6L9S8R5_9ACTN|nr:PucR family transcriptional regulator [Phytoactinopolyspora halotolerans]NEE00982.1 PucR family transcriptional regulator [Phytoactinopolyspora halotolerans]
MLPTVAEVLSLPAVRQGRPHVVAGVDGLNRRVRWSHSAEVSDIARLLRGGDLVLTTGIALPSDDAGLAAYVADLVEAGAAGLIVELGRRWESELPAPMLDACDDVDLPLVIWRREVRFARVTEAIGELVVDAQLGELRAAEQMHQTFTELSIAGAEPGEILAEIRRLAGYPVVLESTRHHILHLDAGDDDIDVDVDELISGWERRSRSVAPVERTAYDEATGWLVTVVGARGDDWGRLIIVCPDTPPQRLVVLAERGASALALQRLAARDRESLERQTHRTLLAALTAERPWDDAVLARCAAAGVPLPDRQLVGLVVLPADDNAPSAPKLRDLTEVAAAAARAAELPMLASVVDDEAVLCLLSLPRTADGTGTVDGLARRIRRAAASAPRPVPVLVAAGTTVSAVQAARRTLNEARQVAAAAARAATRADVDCHRLEDVRLPGLLRLLGDDERMLAFAERELGALRTYDQQHGTTLMNVLRGYLDHGGRKSAAAAALHLSRPALYERLARIEQVLGVGLSHAESVTSLHVAMLILDGRSRTGS